MEQISKCFDKQAKTVPNSQNIQMHKCWVSYTGEKVFTAAVSSSFFLVIWGHIRSREGLGSGLTSAALSREGDEGEKAHQQCPPFLPAAGTLA